MFDSEKFNTYILHKAPMIKDQGLFHGKTGIAIYLFHLGRQLGNPVYTEFAETLIDDVYSSLESGVAVPGVESGLAGIGWGFDYLVKNGFLEADLDDILTELDDRIFQALSFGKINDIGIRQGLIGLGLYLVTRLQYKEEIKYSNRDILLKSILVKCLNKLYDVIEEDPNQLDEPEVHDLFWSLPALLWFLKEASQLHIYDNKLIIIIESISRKVRSTIPIFHTHRLLLSVAINELLTSGINLQAEWGEYADLLKSSFNIEKCLDEFLNKNLNIAHGISGVFYMNIFLNNISDFMDQHAKRIEESEFWKLKAYPLGLLSGLSGILFIKGCLLNDNKQTLNCELK